MKSSEYLYGTHPKEWSEMPYREALDAKVSFGIEQRVKIAKLASRCLYDTDKYGKYLEHYNDVQKAIEFNKALLLELE